jgi:purine-binding chemotaxis protein CheW
MKEGNKKSRATSGIQLVTFRLGRERYAVPVWKVREIIIPMETFPIPGMKDPVDGVINLRGEIIPVVKIYSVLGLEGRRDGVDERKVRIIILDTENGGFGFIVDEVMEVVRVATEDVQPPPEMGERSMGDQALLGIVQISGQMVICLDPGKLLGGCLNTEEILASCSTGNEPA